MVILKLNIEEVVKNKRRSLNNFWRTQLKQFLKFCGILILMIIMYGIGSLWFSTIIMGNMYINATLTSLLGTIIGFAIEVGLGWLILKIIKI